MMRSLKDGSYLGSPLTRQQSPSSLHTTAAEAVAALRANTPAARKIALVIAVMLNSMSSMGIFLSRPRPGGPILSHRQFPCSIWEPVSSPRPTRIRGAGARGEAVKDGRVSAHRRLVLDGFEHGGTLAVVGMTKSRGSPRVVHEHSCHILLFGGSETRTMMQ